MNMFDLIGEITRSGGTVTFERATGNATRASMSAGCLINPPEQRTFRVKARSEVELLHKMQTAWFQLQHATGRKGVS